MAKSSFLLESAKKKKKRNARKQPKKKNGFFETYKSALTVGSIVRMDAKQTHDTPVFTKLLPSTGKGLQ